MKRLPTLAAVSFLGVASLAYGQPSLFEISDGSVEHLYRFEDYTDSAGSINLDPVNSAIVPGKFGSGVSLASAGYAVMHSSPPAVLNISLWYKRGLNHGDIEAATDTVGACGIGNFLSDHFTYAPGDTWTTFWVDTTISTNDTNWHNAIINFAGDRAVYFDGNYVANLPPGPCPSSRWIIGNWWGHPESYYADGVIDDVVLRNTNFSADDVAAIWNGGVGRAVCVVAACGLVYRFSGFFSPVDNPPILNQANAGRTVPVKWRLTDPSGIPVSDPASFVSLTSVPALCSSGDPLDAIETYSGSSGLQYLGDGNWQFNWSTPKSYAGSCRTMSLNLRDGTGTTLGRIAQFQFK